MPYLMCPWSEQLKHIKLFHSHQPSFSITCGLSGCLRTFSNFQVFRNHISAYHSSDPVLVQEQSAHSHSEDAGDEYVEAEEDASRETTFDDLGGGCSSDLQKSTAIVLMGLKEKYKLTQVALQGVIESMTGLVQCRLSELHSQIRQELLSNGVSLDVISPLEQLFTDNGAITNPFIGLETRNQQMNFYRTHFNLIVCLYSS